MERSKITVSGADDAILEYVLSISSNPPRVHLNAEQLIKFHRMIYEEWYFKKLSEARDTKCEAIETKQPQIHDQVLLLPMHSLSNLRISIIPIHFSEYCIDDRWLSYIAPVQIQTSKRSILYSD